MNTLGKILCQVERAGTQLNRWRFFRAGGRRYRYFLHVYNEAWANERTVEVPVVKEVLMKALARGCRVLEVGNVLSHYLPLKWMVVDKYEQGAGVVNCDIIDFRPVEKFDFIVSISTFEHIGFDESSCRGGCDYDAEKFRKVLRHLRDAVLKPGGTLLFSIPAAYNPGLDSLVFSNAVQLDGLCCLKRVSRFNCWREATAGELRGVRYHDPYYCANAVYFGWIGPCGIMYTKNGTSLCDKVVKSAEAGKAGRIQA